jgi:hypothetical protein
MPIANLSSAVIIASVYDPGEPAIGISPCDRFAGGKVDDMRATAEAVEARLRAGVGVLCRDRDYAAWSEQLIKLAFSGHAAGRHNQSASRKASN